MTQYIRKHKSAALFVVLAILCVSVLAFAAASAYRPSRTSTAGSHSLLRGASPSFQNYVADRAVAWIPINGGANFYVADGDSDTNLDAPIGIGGGTPSLLEINSSNVAAYTLDANNESVAALVMLPPDIDLAKDVEISVLWSNSEAAATGSALFTCTYEPFTVGTTAMGAINDALDTAITGDVDLAANVLNWSPWGVIDGGTLTGTPGQDMLGIECKVTLTTIANATVYGYSIRYYRQWLGGGGGSLSDASDALKPLAPVIPFYDMWAKEPDRIAA